MPLTETCAAVQAVFRMRRGMSKAPPKMGEQMMASVQQTYRNLLEAIAFASRAHQGQKRKDGQTPYASHVFRVCLVTRQVFGLDDPRVLMTAVLHDTVEDTTTDFDDLEEQFGREVARWVALLSKDSRLPEEEREKAYIAGLVQAPWQVKAAKLADIFDNLMDLPSTPPQKHSKTLKKLRRYLDALASEPAEAVRRAWQIVSDLHDEMAAPGGTP
jgi:guanosine-3',5'-bis(diphosphate) 3'-pyrophosphohydrolase